MNWVDLAVVLVVTVSIMIGIRRGFLVQCLELVTVALALGAAMTLSDPAGRLLERFFPASRGATALLGFVGVWFIVQSLLSLLFRSLYRHIPRSVQRSWANRIAGIVPAAAKALVLCALIATFVVAFPAQGLPKEAILGSALGRNLVDGGSRVERQAVRFFGEDLRSLFTVRIVHPESDKTVILPFQVTNASPDPRAALKMLDLVNKERASQNPPLPPLAMDHRLQEVGMAHAEDMFGKGYFSHVNREGQSPFDRMKKARISFMAAGENLALAQTVEMAHLGLMNSPGHRRNILSPDFRKVGIAALDGGIHGIMFVQVFSD